MARCPQSWPTVVLAASFQPILVFSAYPVAVKRILAGPVKPSPSMTVSEMVAQSWMSDEGLTMMPSKSTWRPWM